MFGSLTVVMPKAMPSSSNDLTAFSKIKVQLFTSSCRATPYSVLSYLFSRLDCAKLFNHSMYNSCSILSKTPVIIFVFYLISLKSLQERHSTA